PGRTLVVVGGVEGVGPGGHGDSCLPGTVRLLGHGGVGRSGPTVVAPVNSDAGGAAGERAVVGELYLLTGDGDVREGHHRGRQGREGGASSDGDIPVSAAVVIPVGAVVEGEVDAGGVDRYGDRRLPEIVAGALDHRLVGGWDVGPAVLTPVQVD